MGGSNSIEVDGSYRLEQVTLVENTARLVGARLEKADEQGLPHNVSREETSKAVARD